MRLCRMVILFFVAFIPAVSFPLPQEKVDWNTLERIRTEGFSRSKAAEYVWYLSDFIGPRLTASPAMRRAQEWLKTRMGELGLANTALEPWGDSFASWEVEHASIHLVEPNYQMVIGYPLALTSGTGGDIVRDAVLADIRQKSDLDRHRGKLKDKIVLSTPKREFAPRFTPDAVRYDEKALAAYETEGVDINLANLQEEAWMKNPPTPKDITADELEEFYRSEGVSAILQGGQGGDGTVVVASRPYRRNDRSAEGVKRSLPMLALVPEHYNRIYRLLEHGTPVKMQIDVRINLGGDVEGRNVVGEIPGTDLADEIVMIGAHLDSFTSGTGATDNASGCAVVLEAMRILKAVGAKPRRTIRMALWSSEEGGLKGSGGYVRNHFGNPRDGMKPDYEKLSVYFNMDNGTGRFRGVHLQGNRAAAPIFAEWMKPFHDLKMGTLSQFSNRGTDHLSFDLAGLPGFQFIQDRLDYRSRTWHYNMDTYDHLVLEDLKINAVVMAGFAWQAAMRDEKFPRKPFADWNPQFTLHQAELFQEGSALTNAVADFDNDGDLDIFVGFNNKPSRMYRNDRGTFAEVAAEVGLDATGAIRTSAWGDYDGDGNLDLFIASVSGSNSWARLFRNEGNGRRFTDATSSAGVQVSGSFRQASWIDFDNDGGLDLFVALRDKPNVLFQNDKGKFTDVAKEWGVDDPRRSVGAVWFDYDKDGDLDLYVANMDGDANGLFRNDGRRFTDAAKELGVETGGRPLGSTLFGSVRPSLADYDNDGNIDIFCANYGPNGLYRNIDGRQFIDVAPALGLAIDNCYDSGAWGDWDNDGRIDLYVNGTVTRGRSFEDFLFHNDPTRFSDVTPDMLKKNDADHGVQWLDFDGDGDLDLALTNASATGMHYLLRNDLPADRARRSLQVAAVDAMGRYTRAGAEIRIFDSRTGRLLGTGLMDTGSGYNSQNAMPVHFGLAQEGAVDVEVITLTSKGRKSARLTKVNPADYAGRNLTIKTDANGAIVK